MQLPKSEQLNIASLSRLFDNKAECYKLFWFQAILNYVCKGQQEIRFEELIDDMIANAWYMVTEYHLNLGPRDNLEKAVNYIFSLKLMLPNAKQQEILEWLQSSTDPEVTNYKNILTQNVPFRLQAPFLIGFRGDTWKCSTRKLAEQINQQERLMYYFLDYAGLETRIRIVPEWMEYLKKNQEILRGWIRYHMIVYLQRRNPSVPGISDKLYPPQERKLEKVKNIGSCFRSWRRFMKSTGRIGWRRRTFPSIILCPGLMWPMMSFGICIPPPGPSTAARAIICRSGSCIFRALPVWSICRIR